VLKFIKRFSLILIIVGHYCFCGYILNEVSQIKKYILKPVVVNKDSLKINEPKAVLINNQSDVAISKVIKAKSKSSFHPNYLAQIRIPKIGLNHYLYDVNSYMNSVDRNIEILKSSDMPDKTDGNFILAAHNGDSGVGFFRNIDSLNLNDLIIVNYNGKNYNYLVSDKYDILKTGKAVIKRDKAQNSITLITCKGLYQQLIIIGYLKSID
jgi:LPXTG-site transpeptidase (sortase) family protein